MTPDGVMRELAGLQALARSLVHGDSEVDDLVQETAIAAIDHPPKGEVKPWLVTLLLNRWRMDRRSRSRRIAREQAVEAPDADRADPAEALDRARLLQRLADALVALDESLRVVVIRRYLDGQSSADIARDLDLPAGTVRWRLKTGLDRLRAALDDDAPKWRALVPLAQGAGLVKAKTATVSLLLLLLLGVGGVLGVMHWRGGGETEPTAAGSAARGSQLVSLPTPTARVADASVVVQDPRPGQGRVALEALPRGSEISGRVINWSTNEGVATAELTFTTSAGTSAAGAVTVRTRDKGVFELAADQPGLYSLTAIVAPGFLPYAPELAHSPVRIALGPKQAVRGITLFLFPAVDYEGTVVDAAGAPVAGAKVKVSDPSGEQTLEKIQSEWTTDTKGQFIFHAPDFAVFEASKSGKRGWSILDGAVAISHKMTIKIGDAPPRDARITGKTVDESGPIGGVVVAAVPDDPPGGAKDSAPRAIAFATSEPDGDFVVEGLDKGAYTLVAEVDDHARAKKEHVIGGTQNVQIALDRGLALAGTVVDPDSKPIAAYTLLVTHRQGMRREDIATRTVIDPRGRFEVRVPKGNYELLVFATGWAPSAPTPAAAGATDVRVLLSGGATLSGLVVDAVTNAPIPWARVTREGAGGGASASPANAGTVTREDGTFELAGIPPGPLSISIAAGNHHPKMEAGMLANDGGSLGPIRVALTPLAEGEQPKIELVGIGVKLSADTEDIKIEEVVPDGGAAAAGIVAGDHVVTVDGIPVTTLGMDGVISRIRGLPHTTLAVGIKRGDQVTTLVVERKPLRY